MFGLEPLQDKQRAGATTCEMEDRLSKEGILLEDTTLFPAE